MPCCHITWVECTTWLCTEWFAQGSTLSAYQDVCLESNSGPNTTRSSPSLSFILKQVCWCRICLAKTQRHFHERPQDEGRLVRWTALSQKPDVWALLNYFKGLIKNAINCASPDFVLTYSSALFLLQVEWATKADFKLFGWKWVVHCCFCCFCACRLAISVVTTVLSYPPVLFTMPCFTLFFKHECVYGVEELPAANILMFTAGETYSNANKQIIQTLSPSLCWW